MAEMPVSEALDSAEKAYSDAALAAPVADVAVDVTPVAEPKPAAKAKPAPKAKAKVAAKAKPIAPAPKPIVSKAKKPVKPAPTNSQIKEKPMTKSTKADATAAFTTAFADIKDKAQAAYEKGTAVFGEASEFAKGNAEALVESGKLAAAGIQELGSSYVAEAKTAFETLTADVKELAAVKSPADFFELQQAILRRNFDSAVKFGSKSTEAFTKLATDAIAPISSRVSIAVEKVKKAA